MHRREQAISRLRHHPEKHLVERIGGDAIADGRGISRQRARSDRGRRIPGLSRLAGSYRRKGRGANIWRATLRVTFWCALALGITAGIGKLFGTIV
jgi:hypothetical protein